MDCEGDCKNTEPLGIISEALKSRIRNTQEDQERDPGKESSRADAQA